MDEIADTAQEISAVASLANAVTDYNKSVKGATEKADLRSDKTASY